MPTRLTPKVHEELRDRVAIVADDPDWIRDNPDDATAAVGLAETLAATRPGDSFRALTDRELALAIDYLRERAEVIDDGAEFAGAGEPSRRRVAMVAAEHSFAARLRDAAAKLEAKRAHRAAVKGGRA